jgi:LAS superfamily LD-carboxypeptidase LdcB
MRVVEPHEFKRLPVKRSPKGGLIGLACLIIIGSGAAVFIWKHQHHLNVPSSKVSTVNEPAASTAEAPKTNGSLKQLTGEQFLSLYRSVLPTFPNTQEFSDLPPITGNVEADQRIRSMAEARGYRLTRIPVQAIVKINGEPLLDTDNLLQPLAAQGWAGLKAAAVKAGYPLALISAYRSPDYQKSLFTERLYAHGVTAQQVAAARADAAVQDTLNHTAPPAYSREHTGYVVDMWCNDHSGAFEASSCYKWLNANNYEHAKQYGWIPSYPDGVKDQGPDPESWEYVWVGRDRLVN